MAEQFRQPLAIALNRLIILVRAVGSSLALGHVSRNARKPVFGLPTKSDTNWVVYV